MPRIRAEEARLAPTPPTAGSSWSATSSPRANQPAAVGELEAGLLRGDKHQVLLGVTAAGRPSASPRCWPRVNRPALVLAHNKTLAAQLYQEFKAFFPRNAWNILSHITTTTSPKPTCRSRTPTSTRKRRSTTRSTDAPQRDPQPFSKRRDVVIVASVSCIYGLGSPEASTGCCFSCARARRLDRRDILAKLVEARYDRNDYELKRGTFRVRGDVVEIVPAYEETGSASSCSATRWSRSRPSIP